MMHDDLYDEIASQIKILTTREDIHRLVRRYEHENICYDTIMAIYSQRLKDLVKEEYQLHSRAAGAYIRRYDQGEKIVDIANSVSFTPVSIARIIIKSRHHWLPKERVSAWLKSPSRISDRTDLDASTRVQADDDDDEAEPEPVERPSNKPRVILKDTTFGPEYYERLRAEISEAILADPIMSPLGDRIRQYVGIEYELLLREKLMNLGVTFKDESELREMGYKRTPDIKLDVPMQVCGQTVLWIDSKACFGDRATHESNRKQFESYRSVFNAPGLVIYWFGYVQSLNELTPGASTPPPVFAVDHFPTPQELLRMQILDDPIEAPPH